MLRVVFLVLLLLVAVVKATSKVKFNAKLSKTNVNPGDKFVLTVTLPQNSPCHKVPLRCKKSPHSRGCPIDNAICTLQLQLPDGAAYFNHSTSLQATVNGRSDFSSIVTIPLTVSRRVLTHKITFIADSCLPPNKLSFGSTIKLMERTGSQTTPKKAFQVHIAS